MKTLLILCFAVASFAGVASAETVVVKRHKRHHYVQHNRRPHHVTVVHRH